MDEHLSWNHHITHLCKNLVKYFGIFKKLRESITKKLARQLYYAFIYSRIDYGIQIYGSCSATMLTRIQTLSNKLLKFLLKLNPRTPTNRLHTDLKILKVNDIFEVNLLTFVRKCLYKECPSLFNDYFTYQQHNYNVRNPKLHVPRSRINLATNSVRIKGAVLWNALDSSVKSKANLKCFKGILKKHYIGRY